MNSHRKKPKQWHGLGFGGGNLMSHSCSILSASNVSSGVGEFSYPDGVQLWNLWALTLKLRMFLSSGWKWLVGIKCSYSTQKRQCNFCQAGNFNVIQLPNLRTCKKLLGISEVGRILKANGLTYYLHHLWFCWWPSWFPVQVGTHDQ